MISIITATFNAAQSLPTLMTSLRTQTDRDFEWVVVDGGSRDGTVALLRAAGDVVTHWISEPDFGIYHAINKGLLLAKGDYYLVLGADDSLLPDAIASFRREALASAADVVAAPVLVDGTVVRPRTRIPWLRSGPPMVAAHSVGSLFRRSLHEEFGLYSPRFPIAADTFFLLCLIKGGKKFTRLNEPVGQFGTSGLSSQDTLGALCESWRANVAVRGHFWLQLPLFLLRLMANWKRVRSTR
jgi:glycosyltransferase involved in cell wall biosynthesis